LGRPQRFMKTLGYFVNLVILRADFSEDMTFENLLQREAETLQHAMAHGDYPFSELVRQLGFSGGISTQPLTQVSLTLIRPGTASSEVKFGEQSTWGGMPATWSRFLEESHNALSFSLLDNQDHLSGFLRYDASQFNAASMARLLVHLRTLLTELCADPTRRISQLPMLSPLERQQLLVDFQGKNSPLPAAEHGIHHLFEQQVERQPEAIAIAYSTPSSTPSAPPSSQLATLTYRELNRAANVVAHRLIADGLKPNDIVGSLISRRPETAIAFLGILKAGGCYLPIDPEYPQERVAYMLSNSRCERILTCASVKLTALHSENTRVFEISSASASALVPAQLPNLPDDNPNLALAERQLAYLIYTSGSTGLPKGVQVEHRGVINTILACIDTFAMRADDRMLQFSSASFDTSILEMLSALLLGATLVPISHQHLADLDEFARYLHALKVSIAIFPPAFLASLSPDAVQNMRAIVTGGDTAIPANLLALAKTKPCFNAYGPTEFSICSILHRVDPARQDGPRIPIGKPIVNSSILILDAALNLVPIGVAADIYLAGVGLARGYLDDPERTAAAFIANPYAPGTKMYRTGDRGKWLPDGNVDYLGRSDSQVKIRGFRIEPGEIEAVLSQHPQVQEALVGIRRAANGDASLIAWLIPDVTPGVTPELPFNDNATFSETLRAWLAEKLPVYMVPAALVILDAWPLTPNGKIDRARLPEPPRLDRTQPSAAPASATEKQLAALFGEVLGVADVSSRDDFFSLGGHSILVLRLLARIRATFAVEIVLADIFAAPEVGALAQRIDAKQYTKQNAKHNATQAGVDPKTEQQQTDAIDLAAETTLAEFSRHTDQPQTAAPVLPHRLLFTGASGFLGAHLLHELLNRTEASIDCLVRAKDDAAAMQRIQHNLTEAGLWQEAFAPRLIAHAGDLAAPMLGLNAATYTQLVDTLDAIWHVASEINLTYPYARLKASNVEGVRHLLALAGAGRPKSVHYLSTTGLFETSAETIINTDTPLPPFDSLSLGYTQTKWVAEKLLESARQRGLSVTLYRPSRIIGSTTTGYGNRDDFLTLFMQGCLQLGEFPDFAYGEDMLPVDIVSHQIVSLALQAEQNNRIHHLVRGAAISYRDIMAWMQAAGATLKPIPLHEWHRHLLAAGENNAFYPLAALLDPAAANTVPALTFTPTRATQDILPASLLPSLFAHYWQKLTQGGVNTGLNTGASA